MLEGAGSVVLYVCIGICYSFSKYKINRWNKIDFKKGSFELNFSGRIKNSLYEE